ncbi:MAG: glycosyltransferase [Cetobacterium sp.]
MKRIGICIDSLEIGGAEKLLVDIIKLLSKTSNYKIYLLTKNESDSKFFHEIKDYVTHSYLISKTLEEKNKKLGKLGNLLSSLEKRQNFNLFIDNVDTVIDFLDGDFSKFIRKVKNKEKIIWLHLNYEELLNKKKIDKKLEYYNKIIVITKEMYDLMKSKIPSKSIYMVYNLIDFEKIDKLLVESISEEDQKLLDKNFLLTVCRLDEEQKDVTTLIKAFSEYKGNEYLYIIGDGKSREKLEDLSEELKISDKVKFLGIKYNPFIYMRKAKIFVLSSKFEGFGLVVAEALYCGTKVISSDCDFGPREILLNGKIGELFSVGSSEELLKKIVCSKEKTYLEDKTRESLERFSKKNILQKIEEVINE